MTKCEAIMMLKRMQEPEAWEPQINAAAFEALNMAIAALGKYTNVPATDDIISRHAAIDAPFKKWDEKTGVTWIPLEHIELLPSAEPEIIRCKDCAKREYCRTSTVWAVRPRDDWFCADAERRTDG